MKSEFKAKFLQHLLQNKKAEGFTLIELLVVVIIIGILAAIALPNLLAQVGKARESELKNTVGTVNRASQAYHFERQTFSASLTDLGVTVTTQYQQQPTITPAATQSSVITNASGAISNGTRAFAGLVSVDTSTGTYSLIVCGSNSPATTGSAPSASACAGGFTQIR